MSTDSQVDALKALIATATKYPCLDHDEAQASNRPGKFTTLYWSRRFGGNVRGGTRENPLRRLQTRVNADTVSNARLLEDRIAGLFEHATHDLDGVVVHFDFETQDAAFEVDGGYYHRLTDWTTSV